MKQVVLKILKWLFIVTAIVLTVLLCFGLVLVLDWPWWVAIFLLLGLVGLWIAFLFFRKLWLRRREQQFVHQIIDQDEAQIKQLAEKDRVQAKELQDRWKEAIEALKRSHLKKQGNPLYVLPWYLVIGESGTGKTTSIQSARLSSPFSEVARISGISGTRNCDWWFFEQAIILDTAGRYTIRVDEERDKEEWQRFLTLIAKYRQREPLNGLIVTVAADKVLQATPESLQEDGRNVRRRVDELMRVLGAKFPVYLLVTKCDLVHGMTEFCDEFPEVSLNQAMGVLNHKLTSDVEAFLTSSFERTGERLRDLRLLLLHYTESKQIDPGLLLFPEEFEKLQSGLRHFMTAAFLENPYQETPIFRGLFFSSGRQEGTPYSHFLRTLGLIEEREVLPGTSRGLFLHDFFAKILPKDRGLFAPTKRSMEWSRITRNLGLTSWIAIGLAVCGLLSFSFVKNLRAIRWATHEFVEQGQFRGDAMADLSAMDRFREAILRVEEQNRGWWIPRFRLNQSKEAEIRLKTYYCQLFKKGLLGPFDDQMAASMAQFPPSVSDDLFGRHVLHLARRVGLLKARLGGSGLGTLEGKPQPAYDRSLSGMEPGKKSAEKDLFGTLYLYYLIWKTDTSDLQVESTTCQRWLEQMLALKNWDLHWMVGWTNVHPSLSPVRMEHFWKGSLPLKNEVSVTPAYTRKGKDLIDAFMGEIEPALARPELFARSKADFGRWYPPDYLAAWAGFLDVFPKGTERLRGRDEWSQTAARMASDDGPYFAVLQRSASELEPMVFDKEIPPWLKLLFQLQIARAQTVTEDLSQDKGLLGRAAESGKRIITDVQKSLGRLPGLSLESHTRAVQAYQEYVKALAAITPVSASTKLAYDITAQVFGQDEVTGQSPFFTARRANLNLKNAMTSGALNEDIFWKNVTGPLEFLWYYMQQETACYLQKHWEEEVLAETQGLSDPYQIQNRLLSENGFAWKFVRGTAGPFLGRNLQKGGFYSKEVRGDSMPFEAAFIQYLNKGASSAAAIAAAAQAAQQAAQMAPHGGGGGGGGGGKYTVTIRALPTDANAGATLKPHATRLSVQCDPTPQRLDNFNYPAAATFNWSPDSCSDVSLRIEVGDVVLSYFYDGSLAFAKFLRDFRSGQRTYDERSFGRNRPALEQLGIRTITVRYEFGGAVGAVIDLLSAPKTPSLPPAMTPPARILKCWDR